MSNTDQIMSAVEQELGLRRRVLDADPFLREVTITVRLDRKVDGCSIMFHQTSRRTLQAPLDRDSRGDARCPTPSRSQT